MPSGLLIRLRPAGPWRFGPGDGALDRTDTLYRSDRLFSAVTLALQRLGFLDEWLDATARAPKSAVAFTSLFPFQGDTLFAIPPASVWPPSAAQVTAPNSVFLAKIRWKAVHFVPLSVIDALVTGGNILADQWLPDAESGCLLRRDRPNSSPFRNVLRRSAAVDRVDGMAPSFTSTACVEFEPGAGLWTAVRFADEVAESTWSDRVQAAFRLLADSGFGGRRSSGWGHAEAPEFERGQWPGLLLPKLGRSRPEANGGSCYWLLSLYSPSSSDQVDWSGGDYQLTVRSGAIESRSAGHATKKALRMVMEGSVLAAQAEPLGAAVDVAPENFAHPVYRSGFALALELPLVVTRTELEAVEEPVTEEAIIEPVVESELPSHPESEIQPEPETPSEPPISSETGTHPEMPAETVSEVETPPEPKEGPVIESDSPPHPETEIKPELESHSEPPISDATHAETSGPAETVPELRAPPEPTDALVSESQLPSHPDAELQPDSEALPQVETPPEAAETPVSESDLPSHPEAEIQPDPEAQSEPPVEIDISQPDPSQPEKTKPVEEDTDHAL